MMCQTYSEHYDEEVRMPVLNIVVRCEARTENHFCRCLFCSLFYNDVSLILASKGGVISE
jgi:hypothetical protein